MNPTFCSLSLPHKQVRKKQIQSPESRNSISISSDAVCSLNLCRFDSSALLFVLPYLKVADSRPKVGGLADHQILEGAVSMFQCSSFSELIVSQWRSCRLPDTLGRSFKRAFCCAICFAYRLKHIHDHRQSCCGQNWIDGAMLKIRFE